MSGKPDPNISALSAGQDRDIVILNLGQPSKTLLADGKRADVFELERGNEQSVGRATGHAVMDLLTLGGWELIGTPIEGFAGEGNTPIDVIQYGESVLVTNTHRSAIQLSLQGIGAAPTMPVNVPANFGPAGIAQHPLPLTGAQQIAVLDT